MKNLHSAYRAWMLSCLLALAPVHMSWAQAPLFPNDPKFTEYGKILGTILVLETSKMGLAYCGSTYHDLAGLATKSKTGLELRHQDFVQLVESGRAAFYLYIAEKDGLSPRHIAPFWEENSAKIREKKLNELQQDLLQDWTKCLAFIEAVQRGQYDIKTIFPEMYQSVMARKESNNQKP